MQAIWLLLVALSSALKRRKRSIRDDDIDDLLLELF